jgi:hypothetical protein
MSAKTVWHMVASLDKQPTSASAALIAALALVLGGYRIMEIVSVEPTPKSAIPKQVDSGSVFNGLGTPLTAHTDQAPSAGTVVQRRDLSGELVVDGCQGGLVVLCEARVIGVRILGPNAKLLGGPRPLETVPPFRRAHAMANGEGTPTFRLEGNRRALFRSWCSLTLEANIFQSQRFK